MFSAIYVALQGVGQLRSPGRPHVPRPDGDDAPVGQALPQLITRHGPYRHGLLSTQVGRRPVWADPTKEEDLGSVYVTYTRDDALIEQHCPNRPILGGDAIRESLMASAGAQWIRPEASDDLVHRGTIDQLALHRAR